MRLAPCLAALLAALSPHLAAQAEDPLAAARMQFEAHEPEACLTTLAPLVASADPQLAARALLLRARCQLATYHMDEGIADLRAAIAATEQLKDPPSDLLPENHLFALTRIFERLERWDDYLETTRALFARLQAAGADRTPDAATILGNVGYGLTKLDRQAEAEQCFRDAATMLARHLGTGDHPFIALMHSNIGFSLRERRRFEEALAEFDLALAIYSRCENVALDDLVTAMSNRAYGLTSLDRLREARDAFDHAYRLVVDSPEGTPYLQAFTLYNLANAASDVGDRTATIDCLQRSLQQLENTPDCPTGRRIMHIERLGEAFDAALRPWDAIPQYERAVAEAKRFFGVAHPRTLAAMRDLASDLDVVGRNHEAVTMANDVLAAMRRNEAPATEIADVLSQVGYTLRKLGREDEALPCFEEAVALCRSAGATAKLPRGLNNLGACLQSLGRLDEAVRTFEQGLELLGDRQHRSRVQLTGNLGFCLHKLGERERALPLLEKAVALARTNDSTSLPTRLTNLADLLAENPDTLRRARMLYREATAIVERQRSSARGLDVSDRSRFFDEIKVGGGHAGLIDACIRLGDTDEALATVELVRGRGLLDLLEQSRFDALATVEQAARRRGDDALAARAVDLRDRTTETERTESALTHELAAVRGDEHLAAEHATDRAGALEVELEVARSLLLDLRRERAELEQAEVVLAKPTGAAEIRAMLADDERLLLYDRREGVLRLFVVRPAGMEFDVHVLDVDDAVVEAFAAALRGTGGSARGHDPDEAVSTTPSWVDLGAKVFRQLVPGPLWSELRTMRRVLIVPHGALDEVPFEALVCSVDQAGSPHYWLDEGPPIAYGPSASFFVWLQERSRARASYSPAVEVLAVGDPVFAGTTTEPTATRGGYGPLRRLPGTANEVAAIARTFAAPGATVVLSGAEATETAVFTAAPRARRLHFATHGVRDEQGDRRFDALALTHPDAPDDADDGFLKLEDLLTRWRNRLTACELVVLSACDTHAGRGASDEGLFSLPWGFFFAGTRAVVATQWRIDDAATATMMADLYARMAKGEEPEAALLAAKRTLAKTHRSPRFWAPFVMLGCRFH